MQSGRYVKLDQTYTKKDLSNKYQLTIEQLITANPSSEFKNGEWVFIPRNAGILGRDLAAVKDTQVEIDDEAIGYKNYLSLFKDQKFIWPLPASTKVSSGYGRRRGKMHEGIDVGAPRGSHVLAADQGIVVYAASKISGYGRMLVISHRNGFFSVYAHASKLAVSRGDRVEKGQVVALVGSSGRSSGPHLHFEIRRNSDSMNPLLFFPKKYAATSENE